MHHVSSHSFRMESTEKCDVVIQNFNGKFLKTPPGMTGRCRSPRQLHDMSYVNTFLQQVHCTSQQVRVLIQTPQHVTTYSAFLQKHTKVPPLKCQLILSGAQFDVNLLNTLSIKSQVCICAAGGAQQYSQVYVHSMPLFQYVYMIRSEMLTKLCDIKSAQVQTCVCMFVRIAITSVCVHSSISVLCCSPPITSSLLRPP